MSWASAASTSSCSRPATPPAGRRGASRSRGPVTAGGRGAPARAAAPPRPPPSSPAPRPRGPAGGGAAPPPPGGRAAGAPPPLPGEHGFRFFPGFYRHLPDTMRRIPHGGRTVFHNLVAASEVQIASKEGEELLAPVHLPRNLADLDRGFRFLFEYGKRVRIPPRDTAFFVDRLLLLLTSSEERRFAEYENQSWWEFSGAESRGANYQRYLADGLTRTLVAARAREMSARTGGYILLPLLFDMAKPAGQGDRGLERPPNDLWDRPL